MPGLSETAGDRRVGALAHRNPPLKRCPRGLSRHAGNVRRSMVRARAGSPAGGRRDWIGETLSALDARAARLAARGGGASAFVVIRRLRGFLWIYLSVSLASLADP